MPRFRATFYARMHPSCTVWTGYCMGHAGVVLYASHNRPIAASQNLTIWLSQGSEVSCQWQWQRRNECTPWHPACSLVAACTQQVMAMRGASACTVLWACAVSAGFHGSHTMHAAATTAAAVQFYNTSHSLRCAAGVGPTENAPAGWNTAASPYGAYRLFVRCPMTLPGTRYVTIVAFSSTANEFSLGTPFVMRDSTCTRMFAL